MPDSSSENQEDSQGKHGSVDLMKVLGEALLVRGALEQERSMLQAKITCADGQRELLMKTIEDLLVERVAYKREKEELQKKYEKELADVRRLLEDAVQARGELERRRSGVPKKHRTERITNEQEEAQKKLKGEVIAAAQPQENALMGVLQERRAKELTNVNEVEEAIQERYEGLRTVLNTECEVLVKKLLRAEQDQGRLMKVLDEQDRKQQRMVWWWSLPE